MLRVARILRDYESAGSVNSLLAPWGFVDEEVFLTKAGDVGLVYQLAGLDAECLDQTQRRDVVRRFEAAVRLLDEHCRVYQYLCKRRVKPFTDTPCANPVANEAIRRRTEYLNARRGELFEIELYLVLLYEGLRSRWRTHTRLRGLVSNPRLAMREWLSGRTVLTLVETDLDRAVGQLRQKAAAFEVQLADTVRPTRLDKHDAFRFFRQLLNYDGFADGASLRYDTHLDYFVADASVECHRSHLDVGDACVKVLSMKEPPSATFPHILQGLFMIPSEFIACLEWRRIPNDRMRRDIQARRRHFFNKRVSLINYVADGKNDEVLVSDSDDNTVRRLGEALTDIEVGGHFFGECSLTLVCFDENPTTVDRAAAEAVKALATHDGSFIVESYNLLNAWLSIVPGNSAYNVRRLALLETNYADVSLLFTVDSGSRTNAHLGREALVIVETRHQTPYFFNLHLGDVGHTVVLGTTGSGKTAFLKVTLTHAQRYSPLIVVLDLGRSYQQLATSMGGSFVEIGLRQHGVTINPFALSPTPENLHFLHAFVRVLLEGTDNYRLSDAEDRELYEAIENIYVLDRSQRRLFTLANVLPRALAGRLQKWTEGGRYADLFDHVEDTLNVNTFQVFEFESMRAYPALLEPLLFYVLHRVTERVTAPDQAATFKLCVMDEAWRFIQHDRLRRYVEEALKTWRKRNAAMVLATQAIEDFASADLLRTVVESCPTRLFLANPSLDRQHYRELFQLNETELDLLTDLVPRQQFLLKRPDLAKVLTLNIEPDSYWLYATNPSDDTHVVPMRRDKQSSDDLNRLAASA